MKRPHALRSVRRSDCDDRYFENGSAVRRAPAVLLAGALLFASSGAMATGITYALNNYNDGGGNVLSGTITTDGSTGTLNPGNIVTSTFTATGNPAFTLSGANVVCGSGCFSATLSFLTFDFSANNFAQLGSLPGDVVIFNGSGTGGTGGVSASGPLVGWTDGTTADIVGQVGAASVTVATAAVPEPATLSLLGLGLVGLGFTHKRSRARQARAV
ncbi:MAG: PEP-CTERM sorting domain-containing protein [Thiobacillaceae bacterium]